MFGHLPDDVEKGSEIFNSSYNRCPKETELNTELKQATHTTTPSAISGSAFHFVC
jgi:hypothetical protein